jgi:hypothetical protein
MCVFLRQGICIYVGYACLWNTVELILLICLLALSVEGREVECFNTIAGGQGPWLYVP